MWNSSRSTQAVCLHKPFFPWSVPRGFTSLLREEMENSLLDDSVALWSKQKLLIIVGALITHSMFPPQGYPSSARWLLPSKHTGSGVGSCASQGQPDRGILSSPGLETPSTRPCWVLHAWFKEIGGSLFSDVEGLKKKRILTFSFDFFSPSESPIFPLTTQIWENFKTLQHIAFFSSSLTNLGEHTGTSSAYGIPQPCFCSATVSEKIM